MNKLQINCFLLLIGLSTSTLADGASQITLNFHDAREQGNYQTVLLTEAKSAVTVHVKCDKLLPKIFTGKVDIYTVNYNGLKTCNAAGGKLLGSLKCGLNHKKNFKAVEFWKRKTETFYLIGFARKRNESNKRVLSDETCKSIKSYTAKVVLHFCDPVIVPNGKECTMESCPLSLGLGDGRIRDKQISASTELDNKHAAKLGRASLFSSSHGSSWCAAPTFDSGTQYLQVDLLSVHSVSAVSTQGAVTEKSWVTTYFVQYSLDGTDWIVIANHDYYEQIKEFEGNKDQSSLVRHWLKPHLYARFVRFVPLTWIGQRCMRVELHGCNEPNLSMERLNKKLKNEPRLCKEDHCANVPYSTCVIDSGKPRCQCVQLCLNDYKYVCGSDGRTYRNECEMRRFACLIKKRIVISKREPCSGPEECEYKCPKIIKRVCGSDDVTYDNECLLKRTACEKNTEITIVKNGNCEEPRPCVSHHCANVPYSSCVMYGNKPRCQCVQSCTLDLIKVCGSDGVTYQNECEMRKKACLNKTHIVISKREPCSESRGCERKCTAPFSQCVKHKGNEERCECIQGCPKIMKRVCGSDDVTYDNECLLKKTACEKNTEMTIVKNGSCEESRGCERKCTGPFSRCVKHKGNEERCECIQGCPLIMKRVCGSDDVTYDNECLLKKTACEKNTEITIVKNGSCEGASPRFSLQETVCNSKPCPPYATCVTSDSGDSCVCPDCTQSGSSKVCGSDGKTYKHSCELKKHACKKNKRISVVSSGECVAPLHKSNTKEKPEEKKSTGSSKTFVICIVAVALLGVAIAVAMCVFQPGRSGTNGDRRRKNSFESLHNKYRKVSTDERN